jgi:hypothetical protein
MAWNDRFKRASAARQRALRGDEAREGVDDATIMDARRRSPESYLRRHFANVEITASGSVTVPKVLRADLVGSTWVACDWFAGAIGDNIALAMFVQNIGFRDAVRELTGVAVQAAAAPSTGASASKPVAYPRLPAVAGVAEGTAYLQARGISLPTIAAAEAAGTLRFCQSGVLFLGRDLSAPTRSVRSVTVRYLEPLCLSDGGILTKRDFEHSDKGYPAVFPGDQRRVIVVEGGINALAVRDIVRRDGGEAPLCIATGGVGVRKWVASNGPLREILTGADRVEVWAENEVGEDGRPDSEKQSRTDALRQRLLPAIAEIRAGELPDLIYPPTGVNDAAEWLKVRLAVGGPSLSCG